MSIKSKSFIYHIVYFEISSSNMVMFFFINIGCYLWHTLYWKYLNTRSFPYSYTDLVPLLCFDYAAQYHIPSYFLSDHAYRYLWTPWKWGKWKIFQPLAVRKNITNLTKLNIHFLEFIEMCTYSQPNTHSLAKNKYFSDVKHWDNISVWYSSIRERNSTRHPK